MDLPADSTLRFCASSPFPSHRTTSEAPATESEFIYMLTIWIHRKNFPFMPETCHNSNNYEITWYFLPVEALSAWKFTNLDLAFRKFLFQFKLLIVEFRLHISFLKKCLHPFPYSNWNPLIYGSCIDNNGNFILLINLCENHWSKLSFAGKGNGVS